MNGVMLPKDHISIPLKTKQDKTEQNKTLLNTGYEQINNEKG